MVQIQDGKYFFEASKNVKHTTNRSAKGKIVLIVNTLNLFSEEEFVPSNAAIGLSE